MSYSVAAGAATGVTLRENSLACLINTFKMARLLRGSKIWKQSMCVCVCMYVCVFKGIQKNCPIIDKKIILHINNKRKPRTIQSRKKRKENVDKSNTFRSYQE